MFGNAIAAAIISAVFPSYVTCTNAIGNGIDGTVGASVQMERCRDCTSLATLILAPLEMRYWTITSAP